MKEWRKVWDIICWDKTATPNDIFNICNRAEEEVDLQFESDIVNDPRDVPGKIVHGVVYKLLPEDQKWASKLKPPLKVCVCVRKNAIVCNISSTIKVF